MRLLVERSYGLSSSCVGECCDFLWLGWFGEQCKIFVLFLLAHTNARHPGVDWHMWTDARCWGCSWHKSFTGWHEETFSFATHPSSKVISRRSPNVTQRPVAQQQPAPAMPVLHKEGWARPNTPFPLFYKGAWIHKVVKSPIRRLSSAPGQS